MISTVHSFKIYDLLYKFRNTATFIVIFS